MSWLSSEPTPRAPSRTSRPPLQVTGDTTPPNIVPPGEAGALAISANSIDTARSSESVEFTIRVRDAGSPVNIAASSVVYSNGSTNVSGAWTRLSGEDNDGTYQVALSFAEGIPSGTYGLLSITLVDDLGNHQTYSPASLQGLGYTLTALAITDTPVADTTPPNIVAAGQTGSPALSVDSINTSGGTQNVALTIRVQDADSSFNPTASVVDYSNGKTTVEGAWTLVSGNANDGTYSVNLNFAEGISTGVYNLEDISVADEAGNVQTYSRSQLQSLGYDHSALAITDASGSDTTPPNIVAAGQSGALAISNGSIDTSNATQTVQLTIGVEDAGSAFDPNSSTVQYSNGTTTVTGTWALTSGTVNSGTYSVELTFPERPATGVYNIESIDVVDDAGNSQSYSRTGLQALGYDLSQLAISDAPG